jgi:DNA-binding response OmpR family regulator
VLVVEDDDSLRETVCLGLVRAGFSATPALDGDAALEEFRRATYDVVVLDVMIPGPDGYQVCKEITHRSSVPVIMLTARGSVSDSVAGLEVRSSDARRDYERKKG